MQINGKQVFKFADTYSALIDMIRDKHLMEIKCLSNTSDASGCAHTLNEITDKIQEKRGELSRWFSSNDLQITYPHVSRLNEINYSLDNMNWEEKHASVLAKSGDAYELLKERAGIIRSLYKTRETYGIAIYMSLQVYAKNKKLGMGLMDSIESGELSSYLHDRLESGEITGYEMFILDILDGKLIAVLYDNNFLFVPKEEADNIIKKMRGYLETSRLIQLKNAEKQARKFSNDEEKEFEDLQSQYLSFMEEMKSMINKYSNYDVKEEGMPKE